MMRVIVIRTVGDRELGAPIESALAQRVIPLDSGELEAVRAENKRLNAVNSVRAEGDEKRWPEIQEDMARAYAVKRHGRLYEKLLLAWAMLWLEIVEWARYLAEWNREE